MKKPIRVFIVDDNEDYAESTALILEECNCEVKVAGSGEETISKILQSGFRHYFYGCKDAG